MSEYIRKPTPIIMASNALKRLWPVSDEKISYALQPQADGSSPLQKLLGAIKDSDCYEPPIVFVQESALRTARTQIDHLFGDKATIVATKPSVSSGVLCILAAIIATKKSTNTKLVFLPGTLTAKNPEILDRYLKLFSKVASDDEWALGENICFATNFGKQHNSQFSFILEHNPTRPGLANVKNILVNNAQSEFNEFFDENLRTSPIGPAIVRANTISSIVAAKSPAILQACNHAIEAGEKHSNVIRPNDHFLTLGPSISLVETVANAPENTKVLSCGEDIAVPLDWSNPLVQKPVNPQYIVQSAGNLDAQAIIYQNRLLLLGNAGENDVHIQAPSPEINQGQSLESFSTCIEERKHSEIWQHSLSKGQFLKNECHFHRDEHWVILTGSGVANIDGIPFAISAGSTINIPRETCHEIINTGDTSLVLYEIRMGKMMGNDDRLFIPNENPNTKIA